MNSSRVEQFIRANLCSIVLGLVLAIAGWTGFRWLSGSDLDWMEIQVKSNTVRSDTAIINIALINNVLFERVRLPSLGDGEVYTIKYELTIAYTGGSAKIHDQALESNEESLQWIRGQYERIRSRLGAR